MTCPRRDATSPAWKRPETAAYHVETRAFARCARLGGSAGRARAFLAGLTHEIVWQSAAVLEVVHAFVGLVRSPWPVTAVQARFARRLLRNSG